MTIVPRCIAGLALALAAIVPAAPGQAIPGDAALRKLYALPASRFIAIDGEPIHYVDQGRGDAIVLVHGSYASLRQWDGWAKALSRRYRVIRFDRPPAGLSGPDPKGDYSVDREIHIIDALTRRLGVERFFLVATSSGGLSGAGFAAGHPGRVRGLVLNNIAVGPVTFDRSRFSPAFKQALAEDATHKDYHLAEFWRQVMLNSFADPNKVTPAMVREWTDLNNRAPHMPPAPGSPDIRAALGRTPDDLAKITVPTLALWSADDHEVTVAREAQQALALLAARDKSLVVIPHCGHMMPLECSGEGLAAVTPFFDRVSAAGRLK